MAALSAMMLLSGCTTASVNRFKSFSELGRSFETAVDRVIDQAAETNVDANSQELINGRKSTAAERRSDLEASNAAILDANRAYTALKKQNALLSEYFTALGALASFDGESAIGSSTQELVGALQALSPSLQAARIGDAPVGDVLGAAAPLIVNGIKSARLRAELKRHGPIISRQLELQAQLLDALADDIGSDQEVLAETELLNRVWDPYVASSTVPGDWVADRREILQRQAIAAAPAAEAAELSRKLRLAFIGLAEGRVAADELAAHAADLGRLMSLIETVAKPAPSKGA